MLWGHISRRQQACYRTTYAPCSHSEVCIPPRTVKRLTVCPKASSGLKCPPGAAGIVSSDTDEYSIWDAASMVQDDFTVDIVFANTSRTDIKLHPSAPIGYLQLIDPGKKKPLHETTLAEIFDNPDGEPEEPPRGTIQETSTEELAFLDESINIQALDPWASTYWELVYCHHDVISKGKFDLGWTDVVEHKIDLTDDDPVHIRQFRIPLEHRQTIYDWVDKLLKKGAIEVSRSTYNLRIFVVPKPHGQGMQS